MFFPTQKRFCFYQETVANKAEQQEGRAGAVAAFALAADAISQK